MENQTGGWRAGAILRERSRSLDPRVHWDLPRPVDWWRCETSDQTAGVRFQEQVLALVEGGPIRPEVLTTDLPPGEPRNQAGSQLCRLSFLWRFRTKPGPPSRQTVLVLRQSGTANTPSRLCSDRIDPFLYKFQFKNVEYSSGRNKTLLCYLVDRGGSEGLLRGYLEDEHCGLHAEEAFFVQCLPHCDPAAKYTVTW